MSQATRRANQLQRAGDMNGALAQAARGLAQGGRQQVLASRLVVQICLETGREQDGVDLLESDCNITEHDKCLALLALQSRITDDADHQVLQERAADHLTRLLDSNCKFVQVKQCIQTVSLAGLSLPLDLLTRIGAQAQVQPRESELLPLRFLNEPVPTDHAHRNLFVSGCPRSGTTALGQLLRRHPAVALYTERFNGHYGYCPQQFENQNALTDADLDNKLHGQWTQTERKSHNSMWVGDKRPNFLTGWHISKHHYSPDRIRIVHITRSAADVAASYAQRCRKSIEGSENVVRGWPRHRNEYAAAFDLNVNNRILISMLNSRFADSILVVNYEHVFSDPDQATAIFDWLGLPLNTAMQDAIIEFTNKSRAITMKPRLHAQDMLNRMNSRLNRRLHDRVATISSNCG